jgi:hypothetical protein
MWRIVIGASQAPAALQPDDNLFPTLGAAMSGPGPKKKKGSSRGQKISLAAFNAGGGTPNFITGERDVLANLPKHARGDDGRSAEDRFTRGTSTVHVPLYRDT